MFLQAEAKISLQLLMKEDKSKPTVKPTSILATFGPLLFEATQLSDLFAEGRARAYGTLCAIICRHNRCSFAKVPEKLLPFFYNALHT